MKKVLLLISSVVMSLSASAQDFTAKWEKYSGTPEFSAFTAESKYYMWNVGARGFYINHQGAQISPYWGTAASVNDTLGALVHFTKTNPDASMVEKETTNEFWINAKENTYFLVNYVTKFDKELCSFADGWVWTDNNTKPFRFFDVNVNGMTFTITPNEELIRMAHTVDNLAYPEDYVCNPIGVASDDAERMVRISNSDVEWYNDWAFVSEDDYAEFMAEGKEQNKKYYAAQALREAIEKAIAENEGLNLNAQIAVYNNTKSTLENLESAKASIAEVIIAFKSGDASVDKPANFTSLIVNPSFDVQEDFTGWSAGFGAGGTKWTSAEIYGKAFDVHQTISGLKNGVYIVKVNGYTRIHNPQADFEDFSNGNVTNTELYAQSGDIKATTYVKHIVEGGVEEAFGADNENTFTNEHGVEMYLPNTMAAADKYFHEEDGTINPRYENVVYVPVENGELTIGVSNSVASGDDWSIFDDFQLYYIGDTDESYDALKEGLGSGLEYTIPDNTVYSQVDFNEYNNSKKAFDEAKGKAALTEYANTKTALNNLRASITNYASYITAVENADEWYQDANEKGVNSEIEAVQKLVSYIDDSESDEFEFPNGTFAQIVNEDNVGTLSNEKIIAETEYVNSLVMDAMQKSIFEGADLTSMIKNPNFEEANGKGWSTGSLGTPNNWYGGNDKNHCAEAFERDFDVYQVVEGLENGLYEVSVQAFYRTAKNDDAYSAYQNDPEMTGDAKVLSYVYLNEFSTPVRNVMEIQFDENLSNNCFATPAGTYTLDGMASASTAFSLDDEEKNFTMKVYGIVTDGKMRLGIRGEGKNGSRWTLWDNFKLRYMGKNKVAVATVLKQKTDALVELMNQEGTMNKVTKQFIDEQCAPAIALIGTLTEINENTVKFLDKEELWQALANIGTAQSEVEKDVKAYKDLFAAKSKLEDVNSDFLTKEMRDELTTLTYFDEGEIDNMSRKSLEELTARINKAIFWFGHNERFDQAVEVEELPAGYEDATGDVDFTSIIINPDFEEDLNGWKNENMQSQTNTAFGKNGEKYCEKWHADLSLSITQSFKNLPNGFYTLTAHCYNSTADGCLFISAEDDNANYIEDAKFIEDTTTPATVATYSVTVELKGGVLTLGARATLTGSTWFCVDNFKLTYSKEAPATAVETVETAETSAPAGIFTISGARVDKLTKGINIVKMADGSVKKVLVK